MPSSPSDVRATRACALSSRCSPAERRFTSSHPQLPAGPAGRAGGGPTGGLADAGLFYDTPSYGTRTIDAVVRCVGIDQLVYGSDRPVVSPPASSLLGPAAREAVVR